MRLATDIAVALVVAAYLAGCGGPAEDVRHVAVCPPSAALSDAQRAEYADVQACTDLHAPEPSIRYEEAQRCAHGGACCLVREDIRDAEYLWNCNIVVLAWCAEHQLRHEFIHALKYAAQGDLSHDGAEWACA